VCECDINVNSRVIHFTYVSYLHIHAAFLL
jgi:hypothetical protein